MLKSRLLGSITEMFDPDTLNRTTNGIAWDIKVHVPTYRQVAATDQAYADWCSDHGEECQTIFEQTCEMVLEDVIKSITDHVRKLSNWTICSIAAGPEILIEQEGRNGGKLVLKSWYSGKRSYSFEDDPLDANLNSMSRSELIRFRKLLGFISVTVSDGRKDAVELYAQQLREFYEEELTQQASKLEAERPDMYR